MTGLSFYCMYVCANIEQLNIHISIVYDVIVKAFNSVIQRKHIKRILLYTLTSYSME